jgi:SAM-dependent methyltransferase
VDEVTARVLSHFNEIGEAEWDRLSESPRGRVSFELHRRLLAEWIKPGDEVLEVGAGPGRFTIELARLGARVTVTDLSPVQLDLNEHHVRQAGYQDSIAARSVLDVRDAAEFGNDAFDAVVAYGGPLSYVFEDAPAAFSQLVQSVTPGGTVLASVMAAVGSFRYFLPIALDELDQYGGEVYDHVMATGDLRNIAGSHTCQMYRWREIESLIASAPCRLVAASASNCMSLGDSDLLEQLEADTARWRWFIAWEAALCREPGALDGGTHTIFVVQRTEIAAP